MKSTPDPILQMARTQGLLRPADVEELGLPRASLNTLVSEGKLVRLSRGLYAHPDRPVTEHTSLAEIASKHPSALVCLLSALQFHGLTTQAPFEVWIAIASKARAPKSDYPPLRIVRFGGATLTEGVEEHQVEGVMVRITSPAKTVVDCFKFRNKIGLDVALEALREAWHAKRITMDELWHYARICRMSNVMRPYLEALV
ncbi:MAG: type IV toxin-antitoxin system AbiEi family antitoxin domain-containing protein [Thauera sp.]|jgi:predicted transcriptional regulator of viral defense system|nr:type IV toxin-antitoxin system AbiEi family antitoxin domain-containing protein [Thauera sp.]